MHLAIFGLILLVVCFAPGTGRASALSVFPSSEDPARIELDRRVEGIPASATAVEWFAGSEGVWLEAGSAQPVERSQRSIRLLLSLADTETRVRRHTAFSLGRLAGSVQAGAWVIDAWFLLAVPFLMPVIVRRRHRSHGPTWNERMSLEGEEGLASPM